MDKIGKYTIIEPIEKGGMGVVYKALDPRIGRVVAIKTILIHGNSEPELRRRFLQEARSAGALSHKNIITIYEMDEDAEWGRTRASSTIAPRYPSGTRIKSGLRSIFGVVLSFQGLFPVAWTRETREAFRFSGFAGLFEDGIEEPDHKLLLFAGELPDLLQAQRQLCGRSGSAVRGC